MLCQPAAKANLTTSQKARLLVAVITKAVYHGSVTDGQRNTVDEFFSRLRRNSRPLITRRSTRRNTHLLLEFDTTTQEACFSAASFHVTTLAAESPFTSIGLRHRQRREQSAGMFHLSELVPHNRTLIPTGFATAQTVTAATVDARAAMCQLLMSL